MKRDWKKELNDKMYEEWHIDGEDEVDVETFIESLLSEQEEEWKQNIRAIFDECTTDWGTTDFEMAAEKILKLVAEKK